MNSSELELEELLDERQTYVSEIAEIDSKIEELEELKERREELIALFDDVVLRIENNDDYKGLFD